MAREDSLLELVSRARAREPAAMAEILNRFRPLVRKLSRNVPPPDREDLEQELQLLLVQIVLEYDPPDLRSGSGQQSRGGPARCRAPSPPLPPPGESSEKDRRPRL